MLRRLMEIFGGESRRGPARIPGAQTPDEAKPGIPHTFCVHAMHDDGTHTETYGKIALDFMRRVREGEVILPKGTELLTGLIPGVDPDTGRVRCPNTG